MKPTIKEILNKIQNLTTIKNVLERGELLPQEENTLLEIKSKIKDLGLELLTRKINKEIWNDTTRTKSFPRHYTKYNSVCLKAIIWVNRLWVVGDRRKCDYDEIKGIKFQQ